MEEILASIRRIIEDSDGARRGDMTDAGPADGDAEDGAPAAFAGNDDRIEAAAEVEAFRTEFSAPAVEPEPDPAVQDGGEGSQPALRAFDGGRKREDEAAAPYPSAPARSNGGEPRGAIISDLAGRQVAAAFEELNEAFTASRKRSYDEIAEEIMRPMLQEWLDNNLPLLVERLVREEIERVARGGAR